MDSETAARVNILYGPHQNFGCRALEHNIGSK